MHSLHYTKAQQPSVFLGGGKPNGKVRKIGQLEFSYFFFLFFSCFGMKIRDGWGMGNGKYSERHVLQSMAGPVYWKGSQTLKKKSWALNLEIFKDKLYVYQNTSSCSGKFP